MIDLSPLIALSLSLSLSHSHSHSLSFSLIGYLPYLLSFNPLSRVLALILTNHQQWCRPNQCGYQHAVLGHDFGYGVEEWMARTQGLELTLLHSCLVCVMTLYNTVQIHHMPRPRGARKVTHSVVCGLPKKERFGRCVTQCDVSGEEGSW